MNFQELSSTGVYKTLRKRLQHDYRLELDAVAAFACAAHAGQMDNQGIEPYIMHPIRVAHRVWRAYKACDQVVPLWVIQGAILHDVVEDTDRTLDDCETITGSARAARLVDDLTDRFTKSAYPDWNRAKRKEMEENRLKALDYDAAHIVKCADCVDNLWRGANDPAQARSLTAEKAGYLGELLTESGNPIILFLLEEYARLATTTLEPETK